MNIINGLHHILKNILIYGELTEKDDSKIQEYMGNHVFIDNPFPEVYEKPDDLTGLEYYRKSLVDGRFDLEHYGLKGEALMEYASAVDNSDQINLDCENSFVYSYPNRIFNQNSEEKGSYGVNQFNIMLHRLNNNLNSNRAVATIYNPFLDCYEEDIPCLNWLQATVRKNELTLHCMFRSNDIYGAWYGNMLFLTYFGLKIMEELNKPVYNNISFKGIDYHSTSAHVYEINVQDAWKLYKETGI